MEIPMKKIISIILLLVFCINPYVPLVARAEGGWPDNLEIAAEGGILMDADSGVVLYGKNIREKYYPASITKILTALIVIENCNLEEELTFSHNAVHNVEANSSSAGYETGDRVPVRDALYALLLKSANESANALAEHCAGSIEKFAEMMNAKAASLGCVNSHFVNPSGLNDENHYTCAYDFALIAKAAFENPTLREIASTTYYRLPPTKKTPEGLEIYNHHGMLKKRNENYYEWAICGKTGYTMLAGHTLVTLGEKDGLRLITVVLNAYRTHYKDTKSMMEFGFRNFKSINISKTGFLDLDTGKNINLLGAHDDLPYIKADENSFITLPKHADPEEITYSISYDLNAAEQGFALAKIEYGYGNINIGKTYLKIGEASPTEANMAIVDASKQALPMKTAPPSSEEKESAPAGLQSMKQFFKKHFVLILISVFIAFLAFILLLIIRRILQKKREDELELLRRERKKRREALHLNTEHLDLSSSSSISIGLNTSRKSRKKKWLFKRK